MKSFQQVAVLILGAAMCLAGCGEPPTHSAPDGAKITYLCLETHQIVQLEAQPEIPAVNPATGRRTLVPAYRDPKTNKWRPIKQTLPHPR